MALANWEIAVYVLYLNDGASRYVHTEDIALKCFEVAPDSFSWIKRRDLPDKEVARFALVDARKEKNGTLVAGRAGRGKGLSTAAAAERSLDGWQLTAAGIDWVKKNEERLSRELDRHLPKSHRQEVLQKLARVRSHSLFRDFVNQPTGFVPSLGLLAELLRCRADADRAVWEKRFAALRNQAQVAGQADVIDFLDVCRQYVNSETEIQ